MTRLGLLALFFVLSGAVDSRAKDASHSPEAEAVELAQNSHAGSYNGTSLDQKDDPSNPNEPTPREVVEELERRGARRERPAPSRETYVAGGYNDIMASERTAHERRAAEWGEVYWETKREMEESRRIAMTPGIARIDEAARKFRALPPDQALSAADVQESVVALMSAPNDVKRFPIYELRDRLTWSRQEGVIGVFDVRVSQDAAMGSPAKAYTGYLFESFHTVIDLCSPMPPRGRHLKEGLKLWSMLVDAGREAETRQAIKQESSYHTDRHYRFLEWDEILSRARSASRPGPKYPCTLENTLN